jgi:Stage II sporulation protein E (SpoIIE)
MSDELVVDVSQDWVLASDVQQRFMQIFPPATRFVDHSAQCRQIRALGGDCYDFTPLADDRLALFIGDASGKGLAAALMIANIQSSLRAAAFFTGNDLAGLLKVDCFLRNFRPCDEYPAVRECGTQCARCSAAERFDRLARSRWCAHRHVP